MFTIRPLRGGRCHYGSAPSITQMKKSGASIADLLEARIEKGLEQITNNKKWEHQEAFIKIKDHPIKRLIMRIKGQSEASVPVQIKGKIESSLLGADSISYEKFEKEITYRDLKNAALGRNSKSGGNTLIEEICKQMNHMSEIGLA